MNVVGERLTVVSSRDHSKQGRSGTVMLDTANTLVLDCNGKRLRVEKSGNVFQVDGSKKVVVGADISGRLEDRWGLRTR
jgi:RNase P/RNase MRP subunit p29